MPGPVAYAIVVRSSEYDMPPEMLDDLVEQAVSHSGYGGAGEEGSGRRRGRGEEGYGLDGAGADDG